MKTNIQEINEEVVKAIVTQVLERLAPVSRSTDFYHGAPTDTHLVKINSYLSKTTGADDWFVFPVRASDNIVNRSKRKWSVSVLQNMVERTNGVSFLINHDWDDVNASIGFVFDGYLKREMVAPPTTRQVPDSIEHNSEIINDEGYWCYYAWVAIPRSSSAVGAVEERRQQFISTGGLVSKMRLLCPICTKEKGFDVGVYDMNDEGKYICPHSLPGYGWWDGTEDMEMPYVIMSGVYDPVEISAVTSGNLPNAEIVR